jgi:hypothetical protein
MVRILAGCLFVLHAADLAAADATWWSLLPLKKPDVPTLTGPDAKRFRHPIDAFVLAKLKEQGLTPSPEADPRTLIRRLTFDLTGLPPTPAEIETFLKASAAARSDQM